MTETRKTNGSGDGVVRARHAAANPQSKPSSAQSAVRRTASSQVNAKSASSAARPAAAQARRVSASGTSAPVRSASSAAKRPAASASSSVSSKTRVNPKVASASSARTTRAPQKKKSAYTDLPIISRIRELIPKNVNWPLILVIAISVLILIGIITLMSIGISRCAGGCSEGGPSTAQTTVRPQIHLSATDVPSVTDPALVTDPAFTNDPAQAASNPVVPSNGLRRATIRTMGDFVVHEEVFLNANRLAKTTGVEYAYNFAPMIDPVWDEIGNADFTVTNVDGCLGGKDAYRYGYSGYPQFNTPPCILYALRDSSVDMLTLANNHMLDGWFDGLMKTIQNVDSVNLKHIGASRTQEERDTPVIYEINGIKVGFMNYTEELNSMDRQASLDKRAMQFAVHATSNSNSLNDAKALREAGADVIVCFMHWGTEYELEPDRDQKNLAAKLVECGVDVIIGGHPHVVQRAEWLSGTNQFGERQETLCLYSLGNFLSFQREQYKDGGIIFDFTIQEQPDGSFKIVNPGYLPTWVWMTGTNKDNYNFQVLNVSEYINNPPANMTSADYQKMIQSYNDSIAAMSKGVGNLLTK